MRVLLIFWSNPGDSSSSTLTQDLAKALSLSQHEVTAVVPIEKKYNKPTRLTDTDGYKTLYVKVGNFFNLKTKLEKVLTIFTLPASILKNIMYYLADNKFDLIITRSGFLDDPKLINPLKKYFNCPAYLLLYDIFPQTAWDLGIIKNKFIYKFFKRKEQKILEQFNVIWCTSPGNAKYMLDHHETLPQKRVEWIYHYGFIKPPLELNRQQIRKDAGFSDDDVISVFGGNMGQPQKLENILLLAKEALLLKRAKFVFIGVGTEKNKIMQLAKNMQLSNVSFIDYMPREQYDLLAGICDIGLVSLDERFTVPNFPSKTVDYFELSLPILASLDKASTIDYGKTLQDEIGGGLYAISGDITGLFNQFKKLYNDGQLRKSMGRNGRKFYEKAFDVMKASEQIATRFAVDKALKEVV